MEPSEKRCSAGCRRSEAGRLFAIVRHAQEDSMVPVAERTACDVEGGERSVESARRPDPSAEGLLRRTDEFFARTLGSRTSWGDIVLVASRNPSGRRSRRAESSRTILLDDRVLAFNFPRF